MACRQIRAASGLSKDVSFPKPCSRKSRWFGNRWLPQTTCTDALDAQAVFCRRRHQSRWRIIFVEISRYCTRSKSQNRSRTFLSACEGFASSVIATVEPAPVHRRVPYTFADVPLNAGRLVASEVARTALQEHQRRCQERGFDDGEHARPRHKLPNGSALASDAPTRPKSEKPRKSREGKWSKRLERQQEERKEKYRKRQCRANHEQHHQLSKLSATHDMEHQRSGKK